MEDLSTYEKIQQAALEEFLEKGFRGASLRYIVKQAGVTTGPRYLPTESGRSMRPRQQREQRRSILMVMISCLTTCHSHMEMVRSLMAWRQLHCKGRRGNGSRRSLRVW